MMNWDWFIYFAVLSVVLWTAGSWNAFKGSQSKACVFTIAGLLVFGTFIGLLWASLERPWNVLHCVLWERLVSGTLSFCHWPD